MISRILELVREFPRFGYRQITRLLRGEGWQVNFKRVYRLWRQEGLKVPRKKQKRKRLGNSSGGILRRKSERMN
ncbi:IS3 family transposase [Gimesia fumaroli]|uniref:IS3 family transposase n=1 Tax=Gimesia fumaroli TaxID=2527976 RepID=UPI0018D9C4F4